MADSEDVPDLDFSDSECQESVGEIEVYKPYEFCCSPGIDPYDEFDYSICESDEEEEEISHPAPKMTKSDPAARLARC